MIALTSLMAPALCRSAFLQNFGCIMQGLYYYYYYYKVAVVLNNALNAFKRNIYQHL